MSCWNIRGHFWGFVLFFIDDFKCLHLTDSACFKSLLVLFGFRTCSVLPIPNPILRFRYRFHRRIDWNRESLDGIVKRIGIENRLGSQESELKGIGNTLLPACLLKRALPWLGSDSAGRASVSGVGNFGENSNFKDSKVFRPSKGRPVFLLKVSGRGTATQNFLKAGPWKRSASE